MDQNVAKVIFIIKKENKKRKVSFQHFEWDEKIVYKMMTKFLYGYDDNPLGYSWTGTAETFKDEDRDKLEKNGKSSVLAYHDLHL